MKLLSVSVGGYVTQMDMSLCSSDLMHKDAWLLDTSRSKGIVGTFLNIRL